MVDFFNEIIQIFKMFADFLLSYSIDDLPPIGYFFIASSIMVIIVKFILGGSDQK